MLAPRPAEPSSTAKADDHVVLDQLSRVLEMLEGLSGRMDRLEQARAGSATDTARRDSFGQAMAASFGAERDQIAADATPLTDAEEAENLKFQARADSACAALGRRCPAPGPFERPRAYRVRILSGLQRYSTSPELRNGDLRRVFDAVALDNVEAALFRDASRADAILTDVPDGEMLRVERMDPVTRERRIEYFGRQSFVRADGYALPNKRVRLREPAEIRQMRSAR